MRTSVRPEPRRPDARSRPDTRLKPSLEFRVEADQTDLVVDTAHATAGDAVERITVAPIDGTPHFRIVIALQREAVSEVMKAVMRALDEKGTCIHGEDLMPVDLDKGVSLELERPLSGAQWLHVRDALIVVGLIFVVGTLLITKYSSLLPTVFR